MSQSLFSQPLNVINVGIAMFSDDLKKQNVEVTQLDWTPPGQGNMQVVQALDNIANYPAGGQNRLRESAGAGAHYSVTSGADWF